jgi:hypothetical protein
MMHGQRNVKLASSCLYRASTVSKHFLFFHNDAHNCKITGILKQLKFRRSLRHVSVHAGTIIREPFLCLTKTTVMVLYPRRLWRGQCHGSIPPTTPQHIVRRDLGPPHPKKSLLYVSPLVLQPDDGLLRPKHVVAFNIVM